ncbi:MAG: FG-GAP-like repeat-containing protein [Cyclobacteriaceae bacterium]
MDVNYLLRKLTIALVFFCCASTVMGQISSTFNSNAEGWTTPNDADGTIGYSATGGNPGGHVVGSPFVLVLGMTTLYVPFNFVAPVAFRGNKSTFYNGTLRYDVQQSTTGTPNSYSEVTITNSGGVSLYYFPPTSNQPPAAPSWATYSVVLNNSLGYWKTTNSISGAAATELQLIGILSDLASLEIRGLYRDANTTNRLDNVTMSTFPLIAPPQIVSFTPTAANPGSAVTINGSNFNAMPSQNTVYFKSVVATVTNASPTQLTVTVPNGAAFGEITVVNKAGGVSGISKQPFNPTFSDGGRIIQASFQPKVDLLLAASNNITGIQVADLDGDGWNDILTTESAANTVVVFRNLCTGGSISTGSFAAKVSLSGGGNGGGLRTVDLDGDGKLDVIAAFSNGSLTYFTTFRNTSTPGTLSFEPVELWPGLVYSGPMSNCVDVDGDGRPDLIGQHGNGSVSVDFWIAQNLSTPGNIEFGSSVSYFGGSTLDAGDGVSYGDLDNDGKPEMVVKHSFGNQFQIIKNNSTPGTIAFGTPFPIAQGSNGDILIADFNLDGLNDIAWKQGFSNDDVRIRINTNAGGALAATDFATEVILNSDLFNYGAASLGDVNGDGKPDIIITDASNVAVFENVYDGGAFSSASFVQAYAYAGAGGSTYPTATIPADLNGDGKPEMVVGITNTNPRRVSVFENTNSRAPEISLTTVSPLAAPVGASVTITGNYFSTVAAENLVTFGGTSAPVTSASANELTVTVPPGASSGVVSVTRNRLTGTYHLPFMVTFSPGTTFSGSSFAPPVNFTLTAADFDLDVADMNNDGKPDVVAEGQNNWAYSFRNTHTPGPISLTSLTPDDTTFQAAQNPKLVDLDGDGYVEILAQNGPFRNTGSSPEINFTTSTSVSGGTFHGIADFNHDGKVDFVGATGTVTALIENRTSTGTYATTSPYQSFSNSFNYSKPATGGIVAAADFDYDGWTDYAASNPGTDNITVWKNGGAYRISTTQFTALPVIATGDNPGRIYAQDLDVDGKVDLAVIHQAGTTTTMLTLLHNQSTLGTISFARADYVLPAAATTAHINDLDGDGRPEVLVTSQASNQFFILKNNSTPGTLNASSFAAAFATVVTAPRGISTGDINSDGRPDILITGNTNFLYVYENLIPFPTLSIATQPVNITACAGGAVQLTTAATGTTGISYQWQFLNTGTGLFENISDGTGYSGTATDILIVNTSGSFGAGDYRCLVSGNFVTPITTSTAALTINLPPAAPSTTGATICGSGSGALTASGGTAGQYRWYTVSTGGLAIAGETNATYTTPSISVSTTYYVSINNGLCESPRTAVTATVTMVTPPTTSDAARCDAGTVTVTATGGTNGQYRWYDMATGGTAIAGEVNGTFTTPTISSTTTYYVAINDGTCESNRTAVIATINSVAKPSITSSITPVTGTVTLCTGQDVTLAGPNGFSYAWSSGQTTQQITVSTAGTYTLIVSDATTCQSPASDPITVIIQSCGANQAPVVVSPPVTTQIEGKVSLNLLQFISDPDDNLDLSTLVVIIQPSSGAVATIDSSGNLTLDYNGISFSGTDRFTIEVCDTDGLCTQHEIEVAVVGDVVIYTGFSPNGDGQNDFFLLKYIELLDDTKQNHVSIFNRWGDLVFEVDNYNNTTNVFRGLNKNGNELPSAVYFYKITFESRPAKTGYVTLRR